MASLASSPVSPTIRRLWLAGTSIGLFVLTLVIGNAFVPRERRLTQSMIGHDFLAFYTAGSFVAQGRSRDLYDLEKVKTFQHELARREGLEIGKSFGPFWNPPFYAWVFAPLSYLSYSNALAVAQIINVVSLAAALWLLVGLLRRWSDDVPWQIWALIPLLLFFSMPAIQAMTHGQNTMVSLLLLTGSLALWQHGHRISAGIVAGLLFYKPQLGAIFAAALILLAGRRALLGLVITGVWLLAINLLTLPGTLADYVRLLPDNLRQFQIDNVYLWDRHITLRAFWRLLLQGREPGEMWMITKCLWLASWALVAGGMGCAWLKMRASCDDRQRAARRDWFLASAILAMPLLMPFYFDYDLLLTSAAAVLSVRATLAAEARPDPGTRPLLFAWIALYVVMLFSSPLARATHVNFGILCLVAVQFLTVRQTMRDARRQKKNHLQMPRECGKVGSISMGMVRI